MSARRDTIDRRAGFTLIELLVVLSILSVVTTLGTTAFITITTAWNEQKIMAELDQLAQDAFAAIERDLSDTLSYELSGVAIAGTNRNQRDDGAWRETYNADDVFSIPIQGSSAQRTRQRSAKVGYYVDRSSGGASLVRTIGGLYKGFPTTGREDLIPRASAIAFRVEYLSKDPDKLWVAGWDRAGHPEAIRLSLTLEDPDRPEFQVSRKTVLRVHVR